MKLILFVLTCSLAFFSSAALPASELKNDASVIRQAKRPITKRNLIRALKEGKRQRKTLVTYTSLIKEYGVDFEMSEADENDIRRAASFLNEKQQDELITVIRGHFKGAVTKVSPSASRGRTNNSTTTLPDFSNHYAFIIASQNYANSKFNLHYAENDAALFRSTLIDSGYPVLNISSHINARLADFSAALTLWLEQRSSKDTITVYMVGHGISIDGLGYYAPIDTNIEDFRDGKADAKSQLLSLASLASKLQSSKAAKSLLSLDICHPETEKFAKEIGASTEPTRDVALSNASFATFASCRADEESYEIDILEHGLFTYWLCRGLSGHADLNRNGDSDGIIELTELHKYVYDKVTMSAKHFRVKQHPVLRGHHLEGPIFVAYRKDEWKLLKEWTPNDPASIRR